MNPARSLIGDVSLASYVNARRARAKMFSVLCGGAFGAFGKRVVIEPPLRVSGAQRISIGDDVFVGSNSWLDVSAGPGGLALDIGSGCSFSGHCVISANDSVTIGRSVLFARGVYVSDHNHAFEATDRPIREQGVADSAPVVIEDGAWLGQNVVVCPGVHIGALAVVGANSVVLHDLPERCVAVGAPARVVRIRENREEVDLASRSDPDRK